MINKEEVFENFAVSNAMGMGKLVVKDGDKIERIFKEDDVRALFYLYIEFQELWEKSLNK